MRKLLTVWRNKKVVTCLGLACIEMRRRPKGRQEPRTSLGQDDRYNARWWCAPARPGGVGVSEWQLALDRMQPTTSPGESRCRVECAGSQSAGRTPEASTTVKSARRQSNHRRPPARASSRRPTATARVVYPCSSQPALVVGGGSDRVPLPSRTRLSKISGAAAPRMRVYKGRGHDLDPETAFQMSIHTNALHQTRSRSFLRPSERLLACFTLRHALPSHHPLLSSCRRLHRCNTSTVIAPLRQGRSFASARRNFLDPGREPSATTSWE